MTRNSANSLLDLTRGYRLRYTAAIASMAIGTIFLLLVPTVLKEALDGLRLEQPRLWRDSRDEKVESRRNGNWIDSRRANDISILNPPSDAHKPAVPEDASEKPLTPSHSPQNHDESATDAHRANDVPILNPTSDAHKPAVPEDANEKPLTPAHPAQIHDKSATDAQRANDIPILNPSSDAHKPAVPVPGAVLIVVLNVLNGVFTYLRAKWAAEASEGIVQQLRHRLYAHMEKLPSTYFDRTKTGDIVQRCSSDVETVRVFMASQVVEIARVALLLIVGVPIMFWQNVTMSLISLTLFPLLIISTYLHYQKIRKLFEKVDEAEGRLSTALQENLTGIRVARAFARQEFEIEKFRKVNGEFRELEMDLFRGLALFWSLSDVIVLLQLGAVLISGGYFVIQGWLSVGTWVFFWWMVQTIIWPVRQIGRVVADASRAAVSIGRINEILNETEESEDEIPAVHVAGSIEIKNLTFGYKESDPVLKDLSLTIDAGETVAILGPPGAGKSTLVHLLVRLYDYQTGSIKIGGRELNTLNRKSVRAVFGVVLQDPFLYSRTVRENVILGRSDAGHHEVEECAQAAAIHGNIIEFAEGYDTVVGERGVTLSGGQRQRLAIARAILKKPTFLVMDDSLSAVDTKTESHILKTLADRRGKQTTILVAHRLSSTRLADRIFVFDKGRLVQQGTHNELMEIDGPYQRLWTIQSMLEDEIEDVVAGESR